MKIVVTGAQGQLGYDVMCEGQARGHQMIGHDINTLDIRDAPAVFGALVTERPDVIIHCAAYTAVDKAESDQKECYDVNVLGTKNVVEAAAAIHAKLIYISSDYVLGGDGDMPQPTEKRREPVNYYGMTKSLGEDIVMRTIASYFIVRTSWVFGEHGGNFVKTMLRLGREKKSISVVSDQIGSPTYTVDLAKLLLDMIMTDSYGIYHAANLGYCSWFDFATAIMSYENLDCHVHPILTTDYPTAAKRPLNSRLDMSALVQNGFSLLPSWEDALIRFLNTLK